MEEEAQTETKEVRVSAGEERGGSTEQRVLSLFCGKVPEGWQLTNRVRIDPPITKKHHQPLMFGVCVCVCVSDSMLI